MVFILNEEKAAKIFKKYRDVAAFTLGKSKGFVDETKGISVSYQKLAFLPDDDTINAVLNGDVKANKIIKKAVKKIVNIKPDEDDDTGMTLYMLQLINMIQKDDSLEEGMSKKAYKKFLKKHGPNILVFVLDGQDEKRDKFLTKYIKAIFGVFGYDCVTNKKVVKKLFDGKRSKINDRVRVFIDVNDGMHLSKDGRRLFNAGKLVFATELLQTSMANTRETVELTGKRAARLSKHLVSMFSGLNTLELDRCGLKGKEQDKVGKAMKRKNKAAVEAYQDLRKVLVMINPDLKLPKVEYGCTKKSVKKGDPKPKMNAKKFVKFFADKDNRPLLRLVFTHLVASSLGMEIGASDYNKNMADLLSTEIGSDFSKAFVSAAKEFAKSTAV